MKTILIFVVIIECMVLILLTIFKKWTRKTFLAIALMTAVGCIAMVIISERRINSDDEDRQRAGVYMAARLIQEDFCSEALEALSMVNDEDGEVLGVHTIRALAYNLNEAYEIGVVYLENCNSSQEQLILDGCINRETVADSDSDDITDSILELIEASEQEKRQWELEMKVRFMGFKLTQEEKNQLTGALVLAKEDISENRYEDAYNRLAKESLSGDVKNGVIVSNMYVKNYNQRLMVDGDEEYAYIWSQAAALQADLNIASLELEPGQTSGEQYTEYRKVKAKYDLAIDELRQEAAKRAINYLETFEDTVLESDIGYQLQMARLYFISRQMEKAKECLKEIFAEKQMDNSQWLCREADAFRQAYIISLSDSLNDEYNLLFDEMMNGLYQSLFDDENYSSFKEFVIAYLRELYSGLIIRKIDTSQFPEITAEISATRKELQFDENNVLLTDTRETIQNIGIEMVERDDLNISFVLDKSGSMGGNSMYQSKDAIRNSIASLSDSTNINLVTFSNDGNLECNLSQSKYMVMNLVEAVTANGGTNIASGLQMALDSLKGVSGTKVIILLSDGYDQEESQKVIDSVLGQAVAEDVIVYTIGLEGCDELYLQNIAALTGGQFIMVTNTARLNRIYQEINTSLMKSYIVTYRVSDDTEARYMQIQEEDSFIQARKNYSTKEKEESSQVNMGGQQEAGYYKQTGGTDNRR